MRLACLVVCIACGSTTPAPKPGPQPAASPSAPVAAPAAAKPDRCAAWIAYTLEDMTWFVGEHGILDYVDVDHAPAVLAEVCASLTDDEIACDLKDADRPSDKRGCVAQDKIPKMRETLMPLFTKLPA